MEFNRHAKQLWITGPSFIWLFLFFLIPFLIIFAYAFKASNVYGDIADGWTLNTLINLFDFNLVVVLWRTLWLSAIATLICLLLALPMGYYLTTISKRWQNILLLLVVVPFWSSFLIRIFAWKTVLHPDGMLHHFLQSIHIISKDTTLLYKTSTVLFVMVYTFLPFAVLPIFASASKFNYQLIEVAIDLGASRLQAFIRVFLPGIRKGIVTATLMVFIPAVGTYVIPDLVGGTNSEMLGNKIAQKTLVERNLPEASALSTILALAIFFPVLIIEKFASRNKRFDTEARNRE